MLNKKIFISISILFLVFNLLIISSALELNPFAEKKIYESTLKEDMSDFLKEDFNSNYGVIRLSKTFFWIETDKVAEYSLTENTDQCLINCKSKGKAVLYTDGKLFDDKYFLNKKGIEVEIDSQYYIKEIETYYEDVPVYKEVCSMQKIISNDTLLRGDLIEENVCTQELTGYEKVEKTKEVWNEYNFEELKAGNYEWEIRGSKATSQSVDFIPTAQGKSLNEWAWWNSDWKYKRQVNFTEVGNYSYGVIEKYTGIKLDLGDVRFIDEIANVEFNATLQSENATHFVVRIKNKGENPIYLYYGNPSATSTFVNGAELHGNPIAYYYLDEISGTNVYDITGNYNGTNYGSSPNQTGKINKAYLFDGNDYISLPTSVAQTGTNSRTIFGWVYPTTSGVKMYMAGWGTAASAQSFNLGRESDKLILVLFGGDIKPNIPIPQNEWSFIYATYNGTTATAGLINSSGISSASLTRALNTASTNPVIGKISYGDTVNWTGLIDEVGIYNKVLTNEELYEFYTYTDPTFEFGAEEQVEGISINLLNPTNAFNSSSQTIFFNATITPIKANIKNITWRANSQTNFQTLNTNESITLNWTKTFDDGDYTWNITACWIGQSETENCTESDTRTFIIDSTAPTITANLNETILYSEGQEVGLEYNITDSNLGSCWYTYNDINTSINCSETSATITTTLSALDVVVYANDSFGNLNKSEVLSMTIDTTEPIIVLYAGNETEDYYYSGINHTINFTITDDNLDSIWWEYNGVNTSISPAISGEAQSITFEVDVGIYTATIYANDSIGNSNQLIVNWGYGLTEDSITFNPTTIEGSIEDYYLNLTLSGLSLISATFHYDGISQISQIDADGNERFVKIEDFEVPAVTTDEDKEFYWTLVFSDGTILNSTFNNQSVTNIGISGCGGSYTYRLIDLYLKDEETTDTINGYIEVDYSIFNPTTETIVQNYSYLFEDVNTASICSDLDLSDSDFLVDAQIRYYATNYSSELYNIQMGSLETLTNLSLYYLAIDDSTEFLVTYQDENAIRVEGAIIQLLRKYVSKGIYRVVEAPETSADGTAVLHIDLNSVIYDVIVVKDGVELDRFENVVFACDSAYSTLCTQKLYGTLDPGNSIPIETIDDFSYTLTTFNDSIKLTYSITSGVPSDINMILEQIDSFGSKINCNESVTSSGGSIECGFNETIGDSIVKVLVLRDEEPVAIKSYVLEEDRRIEFLGNNYFIALIILLSVVAMAFSSPEWIVMNGVFTMLILGGLTLVRGLDFTIGLGSLMWLIIAGAILVMKISKQEDR